jgi:hypothetical protein
MTWTLSQIVYLVARLALLAGVALFARRFRSSHPMASRNVQIAAALGVVVQLWGTFMIGELVKHVLVDLSAPASEVFAILANEIEPWFLLAATIAGSALAATANLLVAYAALAQPDRCSE